MCCWLVGCFVVWLLGWFGGCLVAWLVWWLFVCCVLVNCFVVVVVVVVVVAQARTAEELKVKLERAGKLVGGAPVEESVACVHGLSLPMASLL